MPSSSSPLIHGDYLASPLDILLSSLDYAPADIHQLADAYHTLSQRLRIDHPALATHWRSIPALAPLAQHSAQLVSILRRDVRRALTPTFGTNVEDTKQAIDGATLSHHAMYLLADVFRFEALYSLFTSKDIDMLLGELLTVIGTQPLPSYNALKTTAIANSVLYTQDLPQDILLPRANHLSLTIRSILRQPHDEQDNAMIISDALDTIANILRRDDQVFLLAFSELLPDVLRLLTAPSNELRVHAANALAAFSFSVAQHPDPQLISTISKHTETFLTSHITPVRELMTTALEGSDPAWALTLVACLPVLLGPEFFEHIPVLRFIVRFIGSAIPKYYELALVVWRAFVWAFGKLRNDCRSDLGSGKVIAALGVVGQELRGGVAFALVGMLLGDDEDRREEERGWGAAHALEFVATMLEHSDEGVREDGRAILVFLVADIGTPVLSDESHRPKVEWDPLTLLAPQLYDGSLLTVDDINHLRPLARVMTTVGIDDVRRLSEDEIIKHWDALSGCWTKAVEKYEEGDGSLSAHILPVWQALLLAQSQLTQTHAHLTASTLFAPTIARLLTQFLPDPSALPSDPASQTRTLELLSHLWDVARNVFVEPGLAPVASLLLYAVLKRDFVINDLGVCAAWGILCAKLVIVSVTDMLEVLVSGIEQGEEEKEVRRRLWALVTSHWGQSEDWVDWRDAVALLGVPLGSWVLSEAEVIAWGETLNWAFSDASVSGVPSAMVLNAIIERYPEQNASFPLTLALTLTTYALRHLEFSTHATFPSKALSKLNILLCTSYESEHVGQVVELLHVLHHTISSTPSAMLEQSLRALEEGLTVWIEDAQEVIRDSDYNACIVPLYETILDRIQSITPSIATITSFAPLLTASFTHIPFPAQGPAAFRQFFEDTMLRLRAHPNAFPMELRICLAEVLSRGGGEIPAGMSLVSTQTQSQDVFQNGDVIKGSQPALWSLRPPQDRRPRESDAADFVEGSSRIAHAPGGSPQPTSRAQASTISPAADFGARSPSNQPIVTADDTRKHEQTSSEPPAKRRRTNTSRLEPITRVLSPSIAAQGTRSRSAMGSSRMVMDYVELVPYKAILRKRLAGRPIVGGKRKQTKPKAKTSGLTVAKDVPLEEDYDAWEVTPESPVFRRMAQELVAGDSIVPETPQGNETTVVPETISQPSLRNPSVQARNTQHLPSAPRRNETSSAPASLPTPSSSPALLVSREAHLVPIAPPPPLRRANTTSSRLQSLQNAHNALMSNISQLPVEDLVDAAKMVETMNVKISERMRRALGGG